MASVQRRCAVVFLDISGSTGLYEAIGDGPALERVGCMLAILHRVTEEQGGRVVKSTGDGLMWAFDEAETALAAARTMQERVAAQQALGNLEIGIHVGCHFGPVIGTVSDLYGDSINFAARVAGLARVAQILTTKDTVARLSEAARDRTRALDVVPVKGRQAALPIYDVLWQEGEELTMLGTRGGAEAPALLRLRHEGRELVLGHKGPASVTFGRDAGCNFVIADRRASRLHARLEQRRNKFVLLDHSANGTWVRMGGADDEVLRREELILAAREFVAIGQSPRSEGAAVVEFAHE
jgi:class 3 adenylate cyclase